MIPIFVPENSTNWTFKNQACNNINNNINWSPVQLPPLLALPFALFNTSSMGARTRKFTVNKIIRKALNHSKTINQAKCSNQSKCSKPNCSKSNKSRSLVYPIYDCSMRCDADFIFFMLSTYLSKFLEQALILNFTPFMLSGHFCQLFGLVYL